MRVELLSDVAISPNLAAGDQAVTAVFPAATARDGRICCMYRVGSGKYSRDGRVVGQCSDDGRSWSAPTSVFDLRHHDGGHSTHSAFVTFQQDGSLLALTQTVEAGRAEIGMFSADSHLLDHRYWFSRSADGGHSWSTPAQWSVQSSLRPAFLTARPIDGGNGRLLVPFEAALPAEGRGNHAILMGEISPTWNGASPTALRTVVADTVGQTSFGDPRMTRLGDGSIIMLLWTWGTATEITDQVHMTRSADSGQTWTQPRPTDMTAQVPAVALTGGRPVAAVNVRSGAHGVRLLVGSDDAMRWQSNRAVQVWNPYTQQPDGCVVPIVGDDTASVWDELPAFTFGSPEVTPLGDDHGLLTYYATRDGILHARACRFRVKA